MESGVFKRSLGLVALTFVGVGVFVFSACAQDNGKTATLTREMAQWIVRRSFVTGEKLPADVIAAAKGDGTQSDPLNAKKCEKRKLPDVDQRDDVWVAGESSEPVDVYAVVEINAGPQVGAMKRTSAWSFGESYSRYWVANEMPAFKTGDWPIEQLKQQLANENGGGHAFGSMEMSNWASRSKTVEALLQYAAREPRSLSDLELASKIAHAIQQITPNRSEQRLLLATFSDRLYGVYNDNINPQKARIRNPDTKNLTLSRMINAAADWDVNRAGVCTNIAQSVATVGQALFPDEDVLVFNSGSHFGVAMIDKDKNVVVNNWNDIIEGKHQQIGFSSSFPTTNVRISKLIDGKLKEITIAKNELGTLLDKMKDGIIPLVHTGVDPSVAYVGASKGKLEGKVGVGTTGSLDNPNSQVVVVMGQRHGKNSDLTVAGAFQQSKTAGENQNVVVSLDYDKRFTLVHYVRPGVSIEWKAGMDVYASYGMQVREGDKYLEDIPPVSFNGSVYTQASVKTRPRSPNGVSFSAVGTLEGAAAVKDYARFQYEGSQKGISGVFSPMKTLGMNLQQVDLKTGMLVPISRSVAAETRAEYQGTNVGQNVSVVSGVRVVANDGTVLYTYVGYVNNDIKGFKTQHNIFTTPLTGLKTETGAQLRGGIGIQLETTGTGKQGNLRFTMPLRRRR